MCIRCDECGDPGIGQQLWYRIPLLDGQLMESLT